MKILFVSIISLSVLSSQDMGYKMYENGDIQSALDYYEQLRNTENENISQDELLYNIGTIYSQMDSTSKASSVFEQAYEDSSVYSSDLSYNYGNTLYRSQQLEESLKAFRGALLSNPDDLDARKNYEFVKSEIKKNKSMQKKNQTKKKAIKINRKKKIEIKKMIVKMMNLAINKIKMIQKIMTKVQLIIKIQNLQISKMKKIVKFNQNKLLKIYLMQ